MIKHQTTPLPSPQNGQMTKSNRTHTLREFSKRFTKDRIRLHGSLESHTNRLGDGLNASANHVQYQEGETYVASSEEHPNGQDLSSSQYWEDLYPGWKYDHNTGQWYQIDGYIVTSTTQQSSEANTAADLSAASDGKTEISYMQQTAQSVAGTLAETGTTKNVSSWSQVSEGNHGYPQLYWLQSFAE